MAVSKTDAGKGKTTTTKDEIPPGFIKIPRLKKHAKLIAGGQQGDGNVIKVGKDYYAKP